MDQKSLPDRFAAPSAKFLIGADQVGRDILSRLIYGARISMVVGLAATTVTVVVAGLVGVPSAYFGGRFDVITQRFVDACMSFPELLVLLTVMSMVGRGQLRVTWSFLRSRGSVRTALPHRYDCPAESQRPRLLVRVQSIGASMASLRSPSATK